MDTMKRKHTFWAAALVLLLCMSLLTGCSGETGPSSPTRGDDPVTEPAGAARPGGSDGTDEGSADAYNPAVTGAYEDGTTPVFSGIKLRLTVNSEEEAIIALYDNTAADALLERLPLEDLSFYDLSGIEKPIERLEKPLFLGQEEHGYDPVTGEMVIYRPWANFTIFYGDFRYSSELVPLGKVESGLEVISEKTENFTGVLALAESE